MGSFGLESNLLEYLKSKSNVDCDCLDTQLAAELGPFVDCTSNQADAYLELLTPPRAGLLKKSSALARQLQAQSDYGDVTYEELAVEIAMISLSLEMAPLIKEAIHVMANPTLTSSAQIVSCGERFLAGITSLCHRLEPNFDTGKLCIKVVATWNGLQACRELTRLGIKTLATTLFTVEQAVLAAEAGCAYVAPFVHELKAFFDNTYKDGGHIINVCLEIQAYYRRHSSETRVKAAGLLSIDEAMKLAGIDSMTIAPELLRTLSKQTEQDTDVTNLSVFKTSSKSIEKEMESLSFIDSKATYMDAFRDSDGGRGSVKTVQAIDIFCEFQLKAEALMRDAELTYVG